MPTQITVRPRTKLCRLVTDLATEEYFKEQRRENLGDLLVVCDLRMKIKGDIPPFVYHEMFKPHSPEAKQLHSLQDSSHTAEESLMGCMHNVCPC